MTEQNKSNQKHMKKESLPAQATGERKPVLKKPRRKWMIPRADAGERWLKQHQREAYLRELGEGTTPHGRQLLRHLSLANSQFEFLENRSDPSLP